MLQQSWVKYKNSSDSQWNHPNQNIFIGSLNFNSILVANYRDYFNRIQIDITIIITIIITIDWLRVNVYVNPLSRTDIPNHYNTLCIVYLCIEDDADDGWSKYVTMNHHYNSNLRKQYNVANPLNWIDFTFTAANANMVLNTLNLFIIHYCPS